MEKCEHEDSDFLKVQVAVLQLEEDIKAQCPSGGENFGRVIQRSGSDEWYIGCPTCCIKWAGGSTVLTVHDRPEPA
ncbi:MULTISPECIES: hypothetical protein [unclassified Arthrobacter]|uniref:hypothetical protein n=1 Tax=unclassified Arthrobacter TaxID=235627 RepID=UPI001C843FF5|nr:hypothetical protein [Arthrobacter sp. MAHUQ-56]MBX7442906.1 hypothetical protein [Arthrobacter sp. MAHUQ-56]